MGPIRLGETAHPQLTDILNNAINCSMRAPEVAVPETWIPSLSLFLQQDKTLLPELVRDASVDEGIEILKLLFRSNKRVRGHLAELIRNESKQRLKEIAGIEGERAERRAPRSRLSLIKLRETMVELLGLNEGGEEVENNPWNDRGHYVEISDLQRDLQTAINEKAEVQNINPKPTLNPQSFNSTLSGLLSTYDLVRDGGKIRKRTTDDAERRRGRPPNTNRPGLTTSKTSK